MQKIFLTLLFAVGSVFALIAQEQAVYQQYTVFPVLVNPGYTGFDDKHELVGNARTSWAGFPGRPTSYTLMYSAPVGDKLALGGGMFTEKVGDMNTLRLQLNYAFRFRLQKAKIGIGLSTEFLSKNIDRSLLQPSGLVDPGDDVLQSRTDGQRIFDASLGIHMLYDEHLILSLAMPNTVRARLDDAAVNDPGATEEDAGLFKHYILNLGYIVDLEAQNFKLIPSIALRNVRDVPYQIDLNLQARFLEDKLIAGMTYRPNSNGSMAFMLGTKYKQLQLLYTYDLAFSNFQSYNSGSHELGIAFSFDRKKAVPAPEPSQTGGQ